MTRDPLSDLAGFRRVLGAWFRRHGRDHPWRRTRDPYAVLVSEVMLQQTRVATVLAGGYFERFLARFPDPATLARAGDDALLRAWEGLGYYRRARLLRDTARAVVARHGGRFPAGIDALVALPGIGRYTAGALRSFAFDRPAAVVDGNVARVLARLFDFRQPVDCAAGRRQLDAWAARLVDPAAPRVFNSALMELGQTHCAAGRPACGRCPVRRFCAAPQPVALPLRKPRPRPATVVAHAVFARRADGPVLLQRAQGGRREGLWQLPLRSAAAAARLPLLATTRYPITRFLVTLHIHAAPPAARRRAGEAWQPPAALARLPLAAPFRRALDSLLANHSEAAEHPAAAAP